MILTSKFIFLAFLNSLERSHVTQLIYKLIKAYYLQKLYVRYYNDNNIFT